MLRHKPTVISLTMTEVKDLDNRLRFVKHLQREDSYVVRTTKPKATLPEAGAINIDSCSMSTVPFPGLVKVENRENDRSPSPTGRLSSPSASPVQLPVGDGMGYSAILRSEIRRRRDHQRLESLEREGGHGGGHSPSPRRRVGGRLRSMGVDMAADPPMNNFSGYALPSTAIEGQMSPGGEDAVELIEHPSEGILLNEPTSDALSTSTSPVEGSPAAPRSTDPAAVSSAIASPHVSEGEVQPEPWRRRASAQGHASASSVDVAHPEHHDGESPTPKKQHAEHETDNTEAGNTPPKRPGDRSLLLLGPRTPGRFRIYNDSLPASSQPQTPENLPEARHQSRLRGAFTAPLRRTSHPIRFATASRLRRRIEGRDPSPPGLRRPGFMGLYGGVENADDSGLFSQASAAGMGAGDDEVSSSQRSPA